MRQDFNYHTHTWRCGHASGSDEEYIQMAIKAGFRILGFADHGPYRQYSNPYSHMEWSQIDEYVASLSALREKYADQISILIGFETEYYRHMHNEKAQLKQKAQYLILGQHYDSPQCAVSYFRPNSEEEILEYGRLVCEGLESGLFTYLCHPDLVMYHQESFTPACRKAAHMIGAKAAETGIPLEVNVHRIAKGKLEYEEGLRYPYPNREFWEILASYPVRCLFGVDAHSPAQLLDTGAMDEAFREIQDLNLDFISEPLF
ncbi:MAG: histidinol-phosphatase [Erysipelotrichaceae bacterium]|nr:histidinol-phosphatase [Erysipelotrichaceae bacterium]